MKNLGINHYNLRAPRPLLDALRLFYCEVVGLHVGARPALASFGYWLYAGEQGVLHLSEAAPAEQREQAPAGTFDHVAFTCAGGAAFQALLERRRIAYRMARVAQTGQVQLFLKDPAGNGVELNFSAEQAAGMSA
jgi:catechol 2,3-dioxygenase-like lactoylglutathione lyase family enzyme